jgi:hypothetical protein
MGLIIGAHHEAHGGCFWSGEEFIKDFDGMCRGISAVRLFSIVFSLGWCWMLEYLRETAVDHV